MDCEKKIFRDFSNTRKCENSFLMVAPDLTLVGHILYIITTVTWSEESDHVELTGSDH
jgi:hypothetical protein